VIKKVNRENKTIIFKSNEVVILENEVVIFEIVFGMIHG
jgi:hypothetical protein